MSVTILLVSLRVYKSVGTGSLHIWKVTETSLRIRPFSEFTTEPLGVRFSSEQRRPKSVNAFAQSDQ